MKVWINSGQWNNCGLSMAVQSQLVHRIKPSNKSKKKGWVTKQKKSLETKRVVQNRGQWFREMMRKLCSKSSFEFKWWR